MERDKSPGDMSPGLQGVKEVARNHPRERLWSLAHHLDVEALRRAYGRIRRDAAVGVDGVTKEQYGQDLEDNLVDLNRRMREMRYRHQPIRRVYIPKDNGKQRPIGVSTTEDKLVQGGLHELLEAIYEQEFLDCSYGFRPGRSAHDALRALDRAVQAGQAQWVLEFDIQSFFDSVDRSALKEMLEERIADQKLMRLIGKCLHVGILDGEQYSEPEVGTVQGSVLSPLLGNIYLHHVLDLWFEREVRPRMRGRCVQIRFADDGLFGFERREDAERVMEVLSARLARYGLSLNPEKTRLVDFRRPSINGPTGGGHGTFDFLGFTHYWRRSLRRRWVMTSKTRRGRLARAKKAINELCRRQRHMPIQEQHAALMRRLNGHYSYFGVKGNERNIGSVHNWAKRAWRKWLSRRSQRAHMGWERYLEMLKRYPLPRPRAKHSLWAPQPETC